MIELNWSRDPVRCIMWWKCFVFVFFRNSGVSVSSFWSDYSGFVVSCHRKPPSQREPVAVDFSLLKSSRLVSPCLFDRQKPARLKVHQSTGTRVTRLRRSRLNWTTSVTPGRVFVLQNRVNTTFCKVVLMVCDCRRLDTQSFQHVVFLLLFFILPVFHWLVWLRSKGTDGVYHHNISK